MNTTGEGLFKFLKEEILPKFEIDFHDMRGQGYDNGANMSGRHVGLQAQIQNVNARAMFVPCSAHTLNLTVNDAAKISYETVGFFFSYSRVVQFLFCFALQVGHFKTESAEFNFKISKRNKMGKQNQSHSPSKISVIGNL